MVKKISKENQSMYLKGSCKDFLYELEDLIESKVAVYNHHYGKPDLLISVNPNDFTYILENNGKKDLSNRDWDELDYTRFRNSFKFKDGYSI